MNFNIPQNISNYIGGQFIEPHNSQYIPCIDPSTAEVISQIPNSTNEDVNKAIKAAHSAFPAWSKSSLEHRFKILNKIAELIESNIDALAAIESLDNGKPISLAQKVDIPRAAENFRFFATAAMQFASESHAMPGQAINYTLRQPMGIVGCISPWNLPLYLFTWKIAPALAMGNCVIAKPSEVTPLSAYFLCHIMKGAGLPDGVFNLLHGDGINCGSAIVAHPDIKAISFTGSTRAGKEIAAQAGQMLKKASLELGGKNPNIIFEDCDWDKMMKTTIQSSFANQGQICLCGSRILVQDSIYDKFVNEFVEKVKNLRVGDPQTAVNMGAIVSEMHYNKILNCIQTAKDEGGQILTGGHAIHPEGRCQNGYFIAPTVIIGLDAHCKTNMEEIFGPVVTIQKFHDEAEALQLANTSDYGLSTTIWTQDVTRAHRISDQIQAGIVWVNCWLLRDLRTPFGGVKNSGIGREGGWEAMRFFSEAKNVCIQF